MALTTKKAKKSDSKKREKSEKKAKKATQTLSLSDLEIDGTVYKTVLPKYFQQSKKWKPKDLGEINSLITGAIKSIFVKPGDTVKKGDCLLLLEAMKMNNEILSPIDGTVQDIFVTENSNVSKGVLMIKITPDVVSE